MIVNKFPCSEPQLSSLGPPPKIFRGTSRFQNANPSSGSWLAAGAHFAGEPRRVPSCRVVIRGVVVLFRGRRDVL